MKGFTLLEVVVALIIAGVAAVALFEAAGSGLHATRTAAMYRSGHCPGKIASGRRDAWREADAGRPARR